MELRENIATSLIILAGLNVFITCVLAAKLIAAQRANIAVRVRWFRYAWIGAGLLIVWAWVR